MSWIKITMKFDGNCIVCDEKVKAKEIGLKPKTLAKSIVMEQSLRPERYTILKEVKMTEKDALKLAKSTGVL